MVRLLRFLILAACFCASVNAFAGTCPSGANYTNPSNPAGPLITLSSQGINSCYYVAANGSDTNAGTSESAPFLHSPGMANCTGNCAGVKLAPGVGVIFRGGDSWHFGNSSAAPYTGVVSNCASNGYNAAGLCLNDINATSTNPIYYGVDPAWYIGSSWARPIFTADNPLCGLGNTPAGCTYNSSSSCLPSAGSACTGVYYVSSCAYPNIGNTNNLVDIGFSEYIWFDDFELTGLCQNDLGQPSGHDDFVNYAADNDPVYLTNLYIHGWSHTKFGSPNGQTPCHGVPLSCVNVEAFHGNVSAAETGGVGESLFFNVVDGSDSDPVGGWVGFCGCYNTAYNVFRYNSGSAPGTLASYHDNLWEYMDGNGHSNLIESAERTNAAIYNNVFRHVELSPYGDGGVVLWPGPVSSSTTDYIFNNVGYDVGPAEYLNMGGTGLTTNAGKYVWFNNTWQTGTSQTIFNCDVLANTALDTNNHYIDDQNYLQTSGTCGTYVTTATSLCQSNTSGGTTTKCPTYSNANTSPHLDQYTNSEVYAYSPAATTNSTVGAGTNVQSYCSALSTAAASDSMLFNAALACQNPIPYHCGYIASTHSVNCQTATGASPIMVARPASAAWDIGAYQMPVPAPSVPSGLK